jgi:hypothetical protein
LKSFWNKKGEFCQILEEGCYNSLPEAQGEKLNGSRVAQGMGDTMEPLSNVVT